MAPNPLQKAVRRVANELWSREAVEQPELAYRTHWRLIGSLGIALPILLYLYGALVLDLGVTPLSSISAYYTYRTRDFFVGVLWTVGWFFFSYKGYSKHDDAITDLACVLALAVSLVPNSDPVWNWFHFVSAALLLFVLAVMSFFIFTKTEATREDTLWTRIRSAFAPSQSRPREGKRRRNRLYRASALVIVASLAGAALSMVLDPNGAYPGVFAFETVALFAFGTAWLTKGGVFGPLGDDSKEATGSVDGPPSADVGGAP
jgi:hypothetical protein